MTGVPQASGLRKTEMRLATLVVMVFVFVSSGAFGVEDMVSESGPGMTVLLLVALPVVWALPMALVCAELGSAIPEEGGYYVWVREGLGEFWGFQAGWWSWLCQIVDSAVYISLVMAYVGGWWPQLGPYWTWAIGAALIALFAYLNIRGLNVIAVSSIIFTIVIIAPFLVMTVLGFAEWHGSPLQPFVPEGESWWSSIGLALAIGVWMYSGFDSMSTLAGEVERPRRLIPKALLIGLPLIVLSYLLPTLAGLAGVGDWSDWTTEGGTSFVEMAEALGGPVLGACMLGAAVISNLALYQEYLASGSRPTYAMAADRLMPKILLRAHPKYGTPYVSILILAAVNLVLIVGTFANLVVIDVFLNMLYYILIFVAAVRLRKTHPDMERPFRVPGGAFVLALISAPAVFIALLTLYANGMDMSETLWGLPAYGVGGLIGLASGPLAYVVLRRLCRRGSGDLGGPPPIDAVGQPLDPVTPGEAAMASSLPGPAADQ